MLDEPTRIFRTFAQEMFDSKQEEFGPCPYCNEPVSRKEVGDEYIALDLSSDAKVYHRDCCPCQTDESRLHKDKLYQELDVRFYDRRTDKLGTLYPGSFVGILSRCPFCFRVFDDDGTEVQI